MVNSELMNYEEASRVPDAGDAPSFLLLMTGQRKLDVRNSAIHNL